MLHPSYTDLMKVVNSEVEPGEAPVVNSRYSIVISLVMMRKHKTHEDIVCIPGL